MKHTIHTWIVNPTPKHVVDIHSNIDYLVQNIFEYIHSDSNKNYECIIFTNPKVIKNLFESEAYRVNTLQSFKGNKFRLFNGEKHLENFIINGKLDKKKFFTLLKSILDDTAKQGKPIKIYGDMVGSLWMLGNEKAAIDLEDAWNELAKTYTFSLYCSYPEDLLDKNKDNIEKIKKTHDLSFINR